MGRPKRRNGDIMAKFSDRFKEKITRQRISQRDIIPTGIKTRTLGDIILSKPTDTLGGGEQISWSFNNGEQVLITYTLSTDVNTKLLATLDTSYYQGSVTAANQLPGGSGVDETQFQFIGPFHDWGTTDNKNVKIKTYILNISAGNVTMNGRSIWRYIANDPTGEEASEST
jgi:hypothetical protein